MAFIAPLLPVLAAARKRPRHTLCPAVACATEPSQSTPQSSSSALDSLSPELKLNAVAVALARQRDHPATLRVLSEMADASVPLDANTQVAVLDAAVADPAYLHRVLGRLQPAGYASAATHPPPDAAAAAAEGEHAPEPDAARALDLTIASSFLLVVAASLSAEFLEPAVLHRDPVEPTALLLALLLGLAFDRYATAAAAWRRLSAGLQRLLADDPARAARADAASFLLAYRLGLPWLPFRPDGTRALRAAGEAERASASSRDSAAAADDDALRFEHRVLLWLVAGPAAELAIDGRLVCTDLRRARAFAADRRRLLPRHARGPVRATETRVRAAVAAASRMLRDHARDVDALAAAMLDGASVGECVVLLDGRFGARDGDDEPRP